MHRFESLPNEFRAWLDEMPKETLRVLLLRSIERRAAEQNLVIQLTNLPADIETLDRSYFSADEDGRRDEALSFFKQARLLAAFQFLYVGDERDALYEFFHSLGDDGADAAISELNKA
jgi:hypothetical protein